MNVMIIGDTGAIDSAMTNEFSRYGAVSIMCRSKKITNKAEALEAKIVSGNI